MKNGIVNIVCMSCFLVAGMQHEFVPSVIDQAVADMRTAHLLVTAQYFMGRYSEAMLCAKVKRESKRDPEFVKRADFAGNTWLHYAAMHKMPDLIGVICQNGGVHTRNIAGITPLMYALHNNHKKVNYNAGRYTHTIVQLIRNWHTLEDLLHLGGLSILDVAVGHGYVLGTQALIAAGYCTYWNLVSQRQLLNPCINIYRFSMNGRCRKARRIARCQALVLGYR